MAFHRFSFPTRIDFGSGVVSTLPAAIAEAGGVRPLVVTDRALAALPWVADLVERLSDGGLSPSVFSGVWGNPTKSQVTAGVAAFRDHGADAIVGLGGGAALDVAKAIALMAHHPGDLFDYEDDKPDARPIDQPIPWWVAIPTTAGTGSEVGRSTVVSHDVTHAKTIMFSPRLLAARVLADPDLTVALPAAVTAATGMDAVTHVIEAFLAKGVQPMCDGIALEGLHLAARSLPVAVGCARALEAGDKAMLTDRAHQEARGDMMNAAMMGGVAFQKGLGVTHSMAHALSTVCDLHHGLANGIVLPVALRFNAAAVPQRLARLATAVGMSSTSDVSAWVERLKAEIGIPATLAEVGVKRSDLDRLVAVASADVCHGNNPRPVTPDDFRSLFQAAGLA